MNIRHILACIDLSAHAPTIVETAAIIAEATGASVTLFHADPSPPAGAADTTGWRRFSEEYAEARDQAAEELTASLKERGISYDFMTLPGKARQAILRAAEEKQTNLVIIGSGAEEEASGIGANVAQILRFSVVPVIVVPTHGEPRAKSRRIERILAPSDFQETSDAGLRAVRDLALALEASVSVCTVVAWPRRTGLLAVQDGAAEIPELMTELVESARNALVDQASSAGLETALPHVAGGNRPSRAIAELAVELGADLIALPSLGKGTIARVLLGSTTERLVGIAPVPVLVYPRIYLDREGD